MAEASTIDLHTHSTISDGTDTPAELLVQVRKAGIKLFALTDHDSVKGYGMIRKIREADDPEILSGVEFSCKDEEGKYHILGYRFDPDSPPIRDLIAKTHGLRMRKAVLRLESLRDMFGFTFAEEDTQRLLTLDNPGKPHIGNLMVKYGYTQTKDQAISEYLNRIRIPNEFIRPEEAIRGVLQGGGIPVLAHAPFGSGDELIIGDELEQRIRKLIGFGLQGVEAFYSGFSPKLQAGMLSLADKFGLYVTAGSDYHGKNKLVLLGDTDLCDADKWPAGLRRFLNDTGNGNI